MSTLAPGMLLASQIANNFIAVAQKEHRIVTQDHIQAYLFLFATHYYYSTHRNAFLEPFLVTKHGPVIVSIY